MRRLARPGARAAACYGLTVVLGSALLSGCGNNGEHQRHVASNPATPVPIPAVTSTGSSADLAASRIVEGLRAHGLDAQISDIRVLNADTDPTHQLGKPGEYVARVTFTDDTLPATVKAQPNFARGATLEVFTSARGAHSAAGHAADELHGETDLLSGAALLRLSPRAPSTLVEHYRTALNETTGTPPQRIT